MQEEAKASPLPPQYQGLPRSSTSKEALSEYKHETIDAKEKEKDVEGDGK